MVLSVVICTRKVRGEGQRRGGTREAVEASQAVEYNIGGMDRREDLGDPDVIDAD